LFKIARKSPVRAEETRVPLSSRLVEAIAHVEADRYDFAARAAQLFCLTAQIVKSGIQLCAG
jgi:hypothetical protein